MKIAKTVTTTYTVESLNKKLNPMNMINMFEELKKAGVDVENSQVETVGPGKFVLTITKNTYYDDSTLNRMEK